jgi:hypothetical protein
VAYRPVGPFEDRLGFTRLLNQTLAAAAAARGYRFLDLNQLYAGPDGALPPEITIDGLHIGNLERFLAIRALHALVRSSRLT